jgi:hypothetical protein
MSLSSIFFGRRLANREQPERKLGAFEGVPAMGTASGRPRKEAEESAGVRPLAEMVG